nr:hypothetical protein [Clostridia bacterium]
MKKRSFSAAVRKYLKPALAVASAVFFAASVLCALYFALFPSRGYLHSDCTDSILWADAAVRDGSMLSSNYNYSAILPFGGQQIFALFVRLFGVTMKAQVLSMAVFTVLFAAAAVFFLTSCDISVPRSLFAAGTLMLVLSSSVKLREI